jgi:hypothetical protein
MKGERDEREGGTQGSIELVNSSNSAFKSKVDILYNIFYFIFYYFKSIKAFFRICVSKIWILILALKVNCKSVTISTIQCLNGQWNGHIIAPQNSFRNNQSIFYKRKICVFWSISLRSRGFYFMDKLKMQY